VIWRPVDASDDLAQITQALLVLRDVIERAAARQNEDPDSDDPRVRLLIAVIADYLRPERRDVFLTILNEHVATAIGGDTDYVWKSLTRLYKTCTGDHTVKAERARVPLVMFCRCRGGGRSRPAVWQLWIQDGSRKTNFSIPELLCESDQPVLDKSLALFGDAPPSQEPVLAPPESPGEADTTNLSAQGRPAALEKLSPPDDRNLTPDDSGNGALAGVTCAALLNAVTVQEEVVQPTAAERDILSFAVFSGLAIGGLAVSAALLALAMVAGAAVVDLVSTLRDISNFLGRGIRF
jgi:hypothetical protein